ARVISPFPVKIRILSAAPPAVSKFLRDNSSASPIAVPVRFHALPESAFHWAAVLRRFHFPAIIHPSVGNTVSDSRARASAVPPEHARDRAATECRLPPRRLPAPVHHVPSEQH